MNYFIDAWKNALNFKGRASRKAFWMFVLFQVIVGFVLGMIDGIAGTMNPETGLGVFGGLYTLASVLPSIAITTRRLHDTDRSGWWQLLSFIPLLGGLVVLVFMLLPSNDGDNRFGSDPRE